MYAFHLWRGWNEKNETENISLRQPSKKLNISKKNRGFKKKKARKLPTPKRGETLLLDLVALLGSQLAQKLFDIVLHAVFRRHNMDEDVTQINDDPLIADVNA